MEGTILTYSKVYFDTMKPEKEMVRIEDIAHALSLMVRANGHFPEFFSVAQHSLQCANEAIARNYPPRVALACLLHDGSEAYLSDITRPVKKNLPAYKDIEKKLSEAIYDRFLDGLPDEEEEIMVKNIDDTCLYYEFLHFTGIKLTPTPPVIVSEPEYDFKPMKDVEQEFLWMFKQLIKTV